MDVRVMIGNSAYAVIRGDGFFMDVQLPYSGSASKQLRKIAQEKAQKIDRLKTEMERMLEAADILERDQ